MGESFVYILASCRNGTLYVGSTAKYNVHQLVYYEMHQDIMEAARRERRFKNWCREWKINTIEKFNPTWKDLYEEVSS